MSLTFVLILGGARSGKSRYAEGLAARSGRSVTYVATAEAWDEEMTARIATHKLRRPPAWRTIEAPLALPDVIGDAEGLVLVDCLTLWLSNVVLAERDASAATDALLAAIARRRGPVIAVSNEVGEGIVPGTPLGRAFRDHQGVLNQRIAREATHVVKMVAGCPLVVKPRPEPEIPL